MLDFLESSKQSLFVDDELALGKIIKANRSSDVGKTGFNSPFS